MARRRVAPGDNSRWRDPPRCRLATAILPRPGGREDGRKPCPTSTFKQAEVAVAAAKKKAVELGTKMDIAVVDSGANLKAFARMDDAWLGSIDIAMRKARTARFFDMSIGRYRRAVATRRPAVQHRALERWPDLVPGRCPGQEQGRGDHRGDRRLGQQRRERRRRRPGWSVRDRLAIGSHNLSGGPTGTAVSLVWGARCARAWRGEIACLRNRVVKFQGPGEVVVESIDYPKLEIPPDVAAWLGIGDEGASRRDPESRLHEHLRQ